MPAAAPGGGTAGTLTELVAEIRFQQLSAVATALRADPAEVRLPIVLPGQTGELLVQRWQGTARDPAGHARVVLDLDLDRLGRVTVDLMYARGQVGGHVTVGDGATRDYLAGRLGELHAGLGRVGIGVSHLAVGTPRERGEGAPPGRFDVRL